MKIHSIPKMPSRRDFLIYSLTSTASLALSGIMSGCTTFAFIGDTVIPIEELQPPNIQCDHGIYLKNCNILDVKNGQVIKGHGIKIRNQKINTIDREYDLKNDHALEINLNNAYVIPGLIDSHCHITFPCTYGFNILDLLIYFKQMKKNYNQHIRSGITTVRDMGAFSLLLQYFNSQLANGNLVGPRVIFCNKFTNVYRSHPDIAPPDFTKWAVIDDLTIGDQSIWFNDMNELISGLEWNIKHNASFIKITLDDYSLMCGGGKIPIYQTDHLRTIFDYSERYNLPVAGHALRKFGFNRGMQWNIHSLEHTIGDAYHTDEEIEAMVKKKVSINPTLTIAQMYAVEEAYQHIPKEYQNDFIFDVLESRRDFIYLPQDQFIHRKIHRNNRKMLSYYKQYDPKSIFNNKIYVADPELFFGVLKHAPLNLKKMREAGVTIGCGTDAGMPFILHGLLVQEMELLSKVGFSHKEILQCATINNAKILNMEDQIGSLEKGKLADLTVLKSNPLVNLNAYKDPLLVIKEGKVMYIKDDKKPLIQEKLFLNVT